MNFKQYYQLSEELKIFDEIFFDESLLSIPKFAAGATTNLGSQLLRGTGNILGGVARTGYGGIQAGTGALQALAGGTDAGYKNIKKGLKTATSGLGQTTKGASQAVASPVTAILRGAQATNEPLTPKRFSNDRNWAQKTFGLNRWEKETESPQPSSQNSPEKKTTSVDDEWNNLVNSFLAEKNPEQKKAILNNIKQLHPEKYQQAIQKHKEKQQAIQKHKEKQQAIQKHKEKQQAIQKPEEKQISIIRDDDVIKRLFVIKDLNNRLFYEFVMSEDPNPEILQKIIDELKENDPELENDFNLVFDKNDKQIVQNIQNRLGKLLWPD